MKIDEEKIRGLRGLHASRKEAIRIRLLEFSRIPSSEYFYELAYCLMTPQSSAVHAERVVSLLRAHNFQETGIDPEEFLRGKEHYIRFHKNKSQYLLETRGKLTEIVSFLSNGCSSVEARDWLAANVKGLGYKEATHFLRNIGRSDGLAILDRHILRNLQRYGAIRTIPDSLSKKKYLAIEKQFQQFANVVAIPLDELDLLFWSMETGEIRK
ncbi:MAG TPA: DNA lyase [Bacteroidota bacterium]